MKLTINQRLPLVALAAFTVLAASAQATHWPMAGGDAGRSGHQPADQVALPMKFRWRFDDNVLTSPIITAGADLEAQRVAWGRIAAANPAEVNGLVRIVKYSSGANVADVDIDDETGRDGTPSGGDPDHDPDIFGPSPNYDVAPMEASNHTGGSTQIYVVHNDDNQQDFTKDTLVGPGGVTEDERGGNLLQNDIALAQIRASDGVLLADQSIGGRNPITESVTTNGYTIESAPVMGPDDGTGKRDIFFVATKSATEKKIFRVSIPDAGADGAHKFGAAQVTASINIPSLNTKARPTLVTLTDPGTGTPNLRYVAVATSEGVRTFWTGSPNFSVEGPSAIGLGQTWTPSVPVLTNGNTPTRTPFMYAASATSGGTVVNKLKQGTGDEVDRAQLHVIGTSQELSGAPAPALALAQTVPTTPSDAQPTPGRVVVTTKTNLYTLSTENLAATPAQFYDQDAEVGFQKTIAATSGDLGFAVTDGGKQKVFYLTPRGDDGIVVPLEDGFTPFEESLNASSAVGQPAVSRGRVVLPSNNGAYTYGASVTILQPGPNAQVKGDAVVLEAYVFDTRLTTVTFKLDCPNLTVPPVPVTANRAVSQFSSFSCSEGVHTVVAEASGEGVETETSGPRTFIVNNYGNPNPALTVAPNPANVGQSVTLNASGSTITAGETETIDQWAFEVDGDNDYNDIVENRSSGGDGIVTHQFATPGAKTVGVRVRDSHGDVATKTAPLRVNAPPSVALVASPNPATPGQTVTIDATGTSDSDGSIAKFEFDLDGNGTFELDNGSNPKTSKAFSATTNVSVRVTDNEGGQTVKQVTVTITAGNQPPVASFLVAPNPARAGQDVGFTAAASKDPDGSIAKYEWDFNGDGTYEVNGGTVPLMAHRFTQAGVYKVGLRVTDNAGAQGTSTVDVIVTAGGCTATARCIPRLTATVSPKRDRALPYRFRTSGRLGLPRGLRVADGCKGRVLVQVKVGKKTVSSRRVRVRSTCRYTSRVTFRDRKRLGTAKVLRFSIKFQGNKVLSPKSAKLKRVRIG